MTHDDHTARDDRSGATPQGRRNDAAHAAAATSEHPGIASAYVFDAEGNGRALRAGEPITLERQDGFIWIHLALADSRARHWISAQDSIFADAREALLSSESHPQLEWRGNVLWGTFYDIQREFNGLGEASTDVRFILTPKLLLTARRHPVYSADVLRRKIDAGARFENSAALFEQLVDSVIDNVGAVLHDVANSLDHIEDRVLSDDLSDERPSLLKIRRIISRQNRLIGGLHTVFSRLDQQRAESAAEHFRALAARLSQRIGALHSDVMLLADRSRMLHDEAAAQLTAATNNSLFVLTILTTLLLPATLVTGFFGMNTKGLPFGELENGTAYAFVMCCLASAVVYWIIRRKNVLG